MINFVFHASLPRPSQQRGFTMVEIMVSVTIVAVLVAVAAPSFRDTIRAANVRSINDELTATIQLARIEAVRRGLPVLMTRLPVNPNCDAVASARVIASVNDWSCGWTLVVDANSNNANDAGEPVLQTTTVPSGYSLQHPGLGITMVVDMFGRLPAGQRFVMNAIDDNWATAQSTTTACLNPNGRIKKKSGAGDYGVAGCNTL